jgi:hypothetical protein
MRQFLKYGSVRGVPGNWRPYRDLFLMRLGPLVTWVILRKYLLWVS